MSYLGKWVMIAFAVLMPALAQAAEFSATVINRMESRETQGKIYMKGEKMRRDFAPGEQVGIAIMRPDRNAMWLLMPEQKSYMEVPFNKASLEQMLGMPKEQQAQMKTVGPETVNGFETEKFEATLPGGGQAMKSYVWVAKKFGVPIKMLSQDGKFTMEYRNIKEGGVADSLFEIPPGYQKKPMPQGRPPQGEPQGGRQGMPPQGAPGR